MRIDVAIVDDRAARRRHPRRSGARPRACSAAPELTQTMTPEDHRLPGRARRQLAHRLRARPIPDWTPLPCATFEDAFAAVSDGAAALGMIPIENSIAGRVADIHHLLPTSGLHIVGEHFLPIHFQLMALPGATLDDDHDACTATSTRSASAARSSASSALKAGGRRRHRRLGARGRRMAGDPTRAALAPALGGRDLRPRHPGATTSRTRRTTPPASSCCRPTPRWARAGQRAGA